MESGKSVEFALRAAIGAKLALGALGSDDPMVWKLSMLEAMRELKEVYIQAEAEEKKTGKRA